MLPLSMRIMVFPASAGVILTLKIKISPTMGFPRIRGGDPQPPPRQTQQEQFSPHPRG